MTTDISSILSNKQLPIDSSSSNSIKQLPIDAVDKLADELVKEYDNLQFRKWYCGVVIEFGYAQIIEWRKRASEGRMPAKLFSKYVKDARTYRGARRPHDG